MTILSIEGLSKRFGSQIVLDNLSFTVPEGAVFGFVGQNGAGKTTTMKIALGLLPADAGHVTVCGETVTYGKTKSNRHVGYLPDVPDFYHYMTAMEYLSLCGEITGLSRQTVKNRGGELLALVGLEQQTKRIGGYSRGMKQRLGIAQALLSRPKLLLCDEPTSALDPVGRKEILDILLKIKESTTVIFSTHILSDVERICDHVAILHHGSIAVNGTLSDIKRLHQRNRLLLEFSSSIEVQSFKSYAAQKGLLDGAEEKGSELILHGSDLHAIQHAVIETLAETALCPIKMEQLSMSLENLFLEVVT